MFTTLGLALAVSVATSGSATEGGDAAGADADVSVARPVGVARGLWQPAHAIAAIRSALRMSWSVSAMLAWEHAGCPGAAALFA